VAGAEASLVVVAEAVLRLLRVLADGRACLLVLEDLHWADPETLAVVEYLADNGGTQPLLCLATIRTDEATPALSLARSLDARRAATVTWLERLDEAATEHMVQACLGADAIPAELAQPLSAWTEGVPFLVEELLAAWVDSGALIRESAGWSLQSAVAPVVPPTFADAVERRLAGLGPDAQAVITAAAVLGRRFDWSLVAAITELDMTAVMGSLRRCVDAQLVSDDDATAGGFQLRHALTRDAILSRLLTPERRELSARALRAVEDAHPTLPGEWGDVAADLAQRSGDLDRAARLLVVAGRRALAQGALVTAEAALERGRSFKVEDDAIAFALDEALTEVLSLSGKWERAVEAGERVLNALRTRSASAGLQAEVHLRLARALLGSGEWESADEQLDHARELASVTAAPALGPRIDALAAHVALSDGRFDEAGELAVTALAGAERQSLPEVACEALEVLGRQARLRDLGEAESLFERARHLAEQHGLVVWRIRALQELASIDVVTSRRLDRLTATREIAYEAGALAAVAVLDLQIATVLAFRFEAEEGLAVAQRCAEEARRFQLGGLLLPMAQVRQALLPMALVRQAQCHAVAGNADDMEACIAEALSLAGGDPEVSAGVWGQCRAMLSLLRENRIQALRELDTAETFLRGRPTALLWVFRGLRILLAALEGRDPQIVLAEMDRSELAMLPHHRALVAYAEAVWSGRHGRAEEATDAFTAARASMGEAGGGYGAGALALRLVAEAALEDGWGDPIPWLVEAEQFFERTGQSRAASACRSLLVAAGAPPPRRGRNPDVPTALASLGVSGREHEVLALVAARLTNKEIAARLYLSCRTVEKHVQHLLTKTGLHSRTELSDLAAQLRANAGDGT